MGILRHLVKGDADDVHEMLKGVNPSSHQLTGGIVLTDQNKTVTEQEPAARYRLAIFDFDGTLADSFPWFIRVVNDAAARYRFRRIEEADVETLRGYSARQMMAHLAVPRWKLPLIVRAMRRMKAADVRRIPLFPGVDELLRGLSERGVELALVTSNSYDNAVRILGPENAARFRYYECGMSVFGKRAGFRRVLRRSGVPRAEAICIGDEIRDLEAARAEGIAFGAVSWGYTRVDSLVAHAPAEVFATLGDIAALVALHPPPTSHPCASHASSSS